MTITQKHINFILAIILTLFWFLPLGYSNNDSSFYFLFNEALFSENHLIFSIILFIVVGSIIGLPISSVLSYFDNSILTKRWFKPFLLFTIICISGSFITAHFSDLSLNLFFYIYHLLFYYFAYRVLKEIKS